MEIESTPREHYEFVRNKTDISYLKTIHTYTIQLKVVLSNRSKCNCRMDQLG